MEREKDIQALQAAANKIAELVPQIEEALLSLGERRTPTGEQVINALQRVQRQLNRIK